MKWYAMLVPAGAVLLYLWLHQMAPNAPERREPTQWVSPRNVCLQVVSRPDTFLCPDRHGWQDIGPVTPVPAVPSN